MLTIKHNGITYALISLPGIYALLTKRVSFEVGCFVYLWLYVPFAALYIQSGDLAVLLFGVIIILYRIMDESNQEIINIFRKQKKPYSGRKDEL